MCTHVPRRHLLVVNVLSGAYDNSLVLETPPKLMDSGMDKHNGISCSRGNEWSITTHINAVGSHQQDGEEKQPDTEAYVLHNSICINRKTGNTNVCFWSQSPGWSLILWMDLILWFWTENAEATKMPGRGQHPHGNVEVCRKKWSPENEGRGWPLDFEPLWDLFCLYLPRLADIFSFLPQEEMPLWVRFPNPNTIDILIEIFVRGACPVPWRVFNRAQQVPHIQTFKLRTFMSNHVS